MSLSAEDRPLPIPKALQPALATKQEAGEEDEHGEHEEAADDIHVGGDTAMKFLLAGGVAGAGTESSLLFSLLSPPLP